MRRRTARAEAAAGRARQAAANAAAAGSEARCGERRTYGGRVHECSRPPHGGQHPYTDQWRRDRQQPVAADHHYFVALEEQP